MFKLLKNISKNSDKRKIINSSIVIFPILFTSIILILRETNYPLYEIIGMEDHIIEYSQFFFFLIAGIISFLVFLELNKKKKLISIIFLLISLSLIFIAGEEISWGQRILNIDGHQAFGGKTEIPLLGYNVQSETNIHNFKPIHSKIGYIYIAIFFYTSLSWLLKYINFDKKIKNLLNYFIIPPILIPYFLPLSINLLDYNIFAPQDYEMVEFLLSLGILIFITTTYLNIKKLNKDDI